MWGATENSGSNPTVENIKTEKGIHIISGCEKLWGSCLPERDGQKFRTLLKGQCIKVPVEPPILYSDRGTAEWMELGSKALDQKADILVSYAEPFLHTAEVIFLKQMIAWGEDS